MKSPRLFGASSGRAVNLLLALKAKLATDNITVDRWNEDTFYAGNILEKLFLACKTDDFAVVLLTKDDFKVVNGSQYLAIPRDNCIFELGLFIGALGLDATRCFMVTSLPSSCLPSDLAATIYIDFADPPDLSDLDACMQAMDIPASRIAVRIRSMKPFQRPTVAELALDDVMSRERVTPFGSLLENERVLVHSTQPIEIQSAFATRVRDNMKTWKIAYDYYFSVEGPYYTTPIASMIQALASAGLASGRPGPGAADEGDKLPATDRLTMLEAPRNRRAIMENLEIMRRHLRVHFVPHVASETFCVHNANSVDPIAECYLRYSPATFIHCSLGPDKVKAYKFYAHIGDKVFGDSDQVKLSALKDLEKNILNMFPGHLHPAVKAACIGS